MSDNPYIALLTPFLKRLKQNGFTGDIDRSLGTCVTLATDNSIFQVLPDVVLFPKSEIDVCHVVKLSERLECRLLVRYLGYGIKLVLQFSNPCYLFKACEITHVWNLIVLVVLSKNL